MAFLLILAREMSCSDRDMTVRGQMVTFLDYFYVVKAEQGVLAVVNFLLLAKMLIRSTSEEAIPWKVCN